MVAAPAAAAAADAVKVAPDVFDLGVLAPSLASWPFAGGTKRPPLAIDEIPCLLLAQEMLMM